MAGCSLVVQLQSFFQPHGLSQQLRRAHAQMLARLDQEIVNFDPVSGRHGGIIKTTHAVRRHVIKMSQQAERQAQRLCVGTI